MLSRILIALIAFSSFGVASAVDLKVLAPNAAKEAVVEAISVFEKSSGHRVVIHWTGTEAITKRILDGEAADVIVNAAQGIDQLAKLGMLVGASRTDFARSSIGVGIPAAAAKVDISSIESIRAALLSAKTIVVSSGTSGRHMVESFARMGISEQLKPKLKQPPSGTQISDFLAAGDADIGFQQVSELLNAKGIQYLGPVPTDLQNYTIYSAALHATTNNIDAARALLAAFRLPAVAAVVSNSGMEPL
jgi:molybdate transport system substrate-binding protein